MRLVGRLLWLAFFAGAPAFADEPAQPPLGHALLVSESGLGSSVAVNLLSATLDGNLKVFSAGVGAGISYKGEASGQRYPWELGLYVSPQVEQGSAQASSLIAIVVHATLLKSFGVGMGWDAWRAGTGVQRFDKSTVFVTLGYGATNSR